MEISFKEGPLAQNRTEELGYDLWDKFVIPPYYSALDILNSRKPKVIVGGRGCGKTMLLRYLSHGTKFSQSRIQIDNNELLHIGLYWRVDTQFVSLMNLRGLKDDIWQASFEHFATIIISIEILKSLESIAQSKFEGVTKGEIDSINFDTLSSYDTEVPNKFNELSNYLRSKLRNFQSWLNNIRKINEPIFYPRSFADSIIDEIQNQLPIFKNSTFYVYLDEYENLLPIQKRLVNTWLKHSEPPLIFNLAMKPNSFDERNTTGNEQISGIHDFREYLIEDYLKENSTFEVFAAEIFFLKFHSQGATNIPLDPKTLNSYDSLQLRLGSAYRDRIRESIDRIFPGTTREELMNEIFDDSNLKNRLIENIRRGLKSKNSKFLIDDFLDSDFKEASLINSSLIYREKPGLDIILEEFSKLKSGKINNYTGTTDWINNNFYGSYLLYFAPLNRPCKFYAGYSSFCQMSKGNIRYLLELCHKSLVRNEVVSLEKKGDINTLSVNADNQAEAAKQASKAFLEEVKTYGRLGNHLYIFVMRIGNIFRHAHRRLTQSEPEQNHFSIDSMNWEEELSIKQFLEEAIKWSVLFEQKSTKEKDETTEFSEYVLNPIYAPYFHISYRKKRKISFSKHEFQTLVEGSPEMYDILVKKYLRKWSLNEDGIGTLPIEY
jgi:hypothetical protein